MPGRHRRLLAIKENEMSDNNATLTVGGDAKEYGILSGSVGPKVIDVRKLYANTACSPMIRASRPRPAAIRA